MIVDPPYHDEIENSENETFTCFWSQVLFSNHKIVNAETIMNGDSIFIRQIRRKSSGSFWVALPIFISKGKQIIYPIQEEGVLMRQSKAIKILSEDYKLCHSVFSSGLREAYLYGSYACGDFDNESDVDILLTVDLRPADISHYRSQIATISSDLSLSHDVTVSIIVKSFFHFHRYSGVLPFYKNVLTEEIHYPARIDIFEDS
ncbi:nucleotidyltransferase domain-containing protein [Acutalibacter sp. 1XD8-36]|nr:nucleotidyltransferase domain-containing protein [Acutalibacter sp. 1XD8-36]